MQYIKLFFKNSKHTRVGNFSAHKLLQIVTHSSEIGSRKFEQKVKGFRDSFRFRFRLQVQMARLWTFPPEKMSHKNLSCTRANICTPNFTQNVVSGWGSSLGSSNSL